MHPCTSGGVENSNSNHKQLKCMATVKVKLRESSVGGKAGVIYYKLCHRRKSQQITTSMRLQPRQWDARRGCVITPLSGEAHALLSVQQRIDRDLCLLHTIIRDLEFRREGYSLSDVVDRFRKSRRSTVLAYVETQAARLEANGKLGTARNYRRTLGSFSDFLGGRDIPFSLVDERLVGQYDDWLRRRGVVRNTVSFYMRILRAVYNRAVKEDVVPQADPFRHVYTGVDQTCKRAVGEDVVVRLRQLDLTHSPSLALARDIFIFSYCTRGMAFVDIAFLRNQDIVGDTIRYVRSKTGQRLVISIEPCIAKLIGRYAGAGRISGYVFPLLSSDDPVRAFSQYRTALDYYNRRLKKLSGLLGLEVPLSSYTSRHTWATAARNHNIPLSVISAGMGHASEKTTQIYLASLENSVIDQANRSLIASLYV